MPENQHLREMERPPAGPLGDLLAAAESVSQDERLRVGRPEGREERPLGAGRGDLEMLPREAEGPGHAAAPLDEVRVEAEPRQQRPVRFHAEHRLLVAVSLDDRR